jgi:hypothetical protein
MPTRTSLAIAMALAIAGPAAAAHAAGWTSAVQMTGPDATVDGLVTAMSADTKEQFAAWRDNLHSIAVASRPPGGTFTVTPLAGPTGVNPPVIATGADGRAIVAWQANGTIYVADRPPGGAFTVLGALTGTAYSTVVTVTSDGTEIMAWSDAAGAYARAKPAGGVFGSTSTLYTNLSGESTSVLDAASDPQGNALIAHEAVVPNSPYTSTVRTSRRAPGSGFEPAQVVTSASVGGSGNSRLFDAIQVGFDAAGDALLTARDVMNSEVSPGVDGQTIRIVASWRPPGTAGWSAPQELEPPRVLATGGGPSTGTSAFGPMSAIEPSGAATVAWNVYGPPSSSGIRAAATTSPAAAFSPATDVASSTDNATRYGSVGLAGQRDGAVLLVGGHGTAFESGVRPAGAAAFGPLTPFTPPDQDLSTSGPVLASDPDGDTFASWRLYDAGATKFRAWGATYDASPPVLADISVPASATIGSPIAMSASATDVLTSVSSVSWTFGDGATADGTAVSHAYSAPGDQTVTVTATDAMGNAASATRTVTVAPVAIPAVARPVISKFGISPKRFAVGPRATALTAKKTPRGTKLRFSVSAAGTVKVSFARLVAGRRSGKRCVKPTHRLRKHKRCTRALKVKKGLTRRVAAGPGSIAFSGRLGPKALRRGNYRATITESVTGAPARSLPRSAKFKIVR